MEIYFGIDAFTELAKEQIIVIAVCPNCDEQWEMQVDCSESSWNRLNKYEEEIIEKGYASNQCECCYYQSFSDSYFETKEDDGRYSPVDVYGVKGLL